MREFRIENMENQARTQTGLGSVTSLEPGERVGSVRKTR